MLLISANPNESTATTLDNNINSDMEEDPTHLTTNGASNQIISTALIESMEESTPEQDEVKPDEKSEPDEHASSYESGDLSQGSDKEELRSIH